jgi:hypothetical protein
VQLDLGTVSGETVSTVQSAIKSLVEANPMAKPTEIEAQFLKKNENMLVHLPTATQIKKMINNTRQSLKDSDLDRLRLANTHQEEDFCQAVIFHRKQITAILFSKFQAKLLLK